MKDRLDKLEAFVNEMCAVQNLEGWQGKFFRRARALALSRKVPRDFDGNPIEPLEVAMTDDEIMTELVRLTAIYDQAKKQYNMDKKQLDLSDKQLNDAARELSAFYVKHDLVNRGWSQWDRRIGEKK